MTLTKPLVVVCVGQARDRGQLDADASTEAWFGFFLKFYVLC